MSNQDASPSDETIRRVESSGGPVQQGDADPDSKRLPQPSGDSTTSLSPETAGMIRHEAEVESGRETDPPPNVAANDAPQLEPGLEEAKTVIRQAAASGNRRHGSAGRTPADIAKVLVGEQLNQYYLEALIGGGGMGAVFRAHDQRLDRIVALKVIPFVGNDPELQRRFRNEAQNAAKLDHPKIARVFDAGSYDDWHYIVFEYIKGTNVRDLVDHHGVLSLDDAVVFTSQVAEALDHAAQRGIVHRDIKPSNVLVSEDGSVKLVDMGLARSDNLDLSEDMTASGVTLGTFDYISPEQAFDPRDADLRSDLYSLGCTFYFMMTGEAPYTGGTMLQKLISHGNAPPPNPQQLRPDLPDEVVAVMHRMMAKDPLSRYQNARDLLADLNELAYRFQLKRAQSNAVVTAPAGNEGLHRLQLHLPWMIAGLLIVMIAGYLELQSTATRDAFVINRPDSLNRTRTSAQSTLPSIIAPTDEQSGAGRTTPDSESDTAPTTQPLSPSDSESSTTRSEAEDETNATMEPDRLNDGSSAESNPSTVNISEAAARPPSFDARLPSPDMIAAGNAPTSSSGAGSTGGEQPSQSIKDPSGPGLNDRTSSNTSTKTNSGDRDTTSLGNGATPTVSPTRPAPTMELPIPKSVRVVAPSLLALAMRVDQVDRDTDGAILAGTLDDAIDLAMRFGVLKIELETPEVVTGPIAIPQDNMVFESTVGRTTIRMVSDDKLGIGRSEMLNIGNNRTQFRNLDFHWELLQEHVDGGSMFVINDNRLTRFQNCSFTLVNKAIHDGVTFFQVVTDPEALPDSATLPGRLFNPNENALPLVAIQFDNSIVRGEATFIQMDYAAALQLVWNNGLLAISGRLLDTSGARRRPPLVASPIQLSLTNVTAEIPLGLVRMQLRPTGNYPVPIERLADQCVFIVDEGQPHVELIGVESLTPEMPYLTVHGKDNAYIGSPTLSDPLLYLSDRQGKMAVDSMEELASQRLPWIDEQRPHWSVRWSTARPRSQTYHRLTPTTYRQDGVINFGFQEPDLPLLQ